MISPSDAGPVVPSLRGSLLALLALLLGILLGSCSDSPTVGLAANAGQARLSVNPAVMVLNDGETGTFQAHLTDALGTAIHARELNWTSSSPGVATVSSTGFVEAKHPGEARIRVAAPKHGAQTEVEVLVRPVADDVVFVVRNEVHTGLAGEPLPDSVAVRVIDRGGLPVPGVPVAFDVETGSGRTSPIIAVTDAGGYARTEWTLGSELGAHALAVSDAAGAGAGALGAPPKGKGRHSKIHGWAEPGRPHHVTVTPGADTLDVNDSNRLTTVVTDKWGNTVHGVPVVWTTSNDPVATVDAAGNVVGKSEGEATITATVVGGDGVAGPQAAPPNRTVEGKALVAVKLPGGTSLVRTGGNGQVGTVGAALPAPLQIRVQDHRGEPMSGFEVSWAVSAGGGSLSTTSSVTDGSGNANVLWTLGTAPGHQEITAWAAGAGKTVTFSATAKVGSASRILVTPSTVSLEAGGTAQLTAVATDKYGNQITGRPVSWHSNSSLVATVDVGGFVTAVSGGSTSVEARLDGVKGSTQVTVEGGGGGGGGEGDWRVAVNPSSAKLNSLGAAKDLVATVSRSDGTMLPGAAVTWASLDPDIVTVDAFGRIRSLALGSALITAVTTTGAADTALVESRQVVAAVDVAPKDPRISGGQRITLTASATDSLGGEVQNQAFEWITTDADVALIDGTGQVTGVAGGKATIVAEAKGITGWTDILVDVPPSVTLEVVETKTDSVLVDVVWTGTGTYGLDVRQDSVSATGVNNGFPSSASRITIFSGSADGGRHRLAVSRLLRTSWIGAAVRWQPHGATAGDWGHSAALEIAGQSSSPPPPPPPPPSSHFAAFPGAQGYGAMALTGCSRSNMEVRRVTNLKDSGAGSLRAAIEGALSDRLTVIVFDVAGVIRLDSRIEIRDSCIYVAGQTAPGSGITISGGGGQALFTRGDVSDIVIRYVRMRGGYTGDKIGAVNLLVASGQNMIFDHMSFSWTTDKLFALSKYDESWSTPISNVTVQRSILSEVFSYHPTAVQLSATDRWNPQVRDIDMHHNLFAHNSHRNPNNITNGLKFVNNVVYNWNQAASQGSERSVADWIGNYYKRGPIANELDWEITYVCGHNAASYYAVRNVGPHNTSDTADNWTGASRMVACYYRTGAYVGEPLPSSHRRNSPLPGPSQSPIQEQSAAAAYASVLQDVGANARITCDGTWVTNSDAVDQRVIKEVKNGSGFNRLIKNEGEVGGFPGISTGQSCPDSDLDGMPNAFEIRYGLNPNDPSDAKRLHEGGYTFLEVYVNGQT